jgi:hypothetical protein
VLCFRSVILNYGWIRWSFGVIDDVGWNYGIEFLMESKIRIDFGVPFFCSRICVLKWWIYGVFSCLISIEYLRLLRLVGFLCCFTFSLWVNFLLWLMFVVSWLAHFDVYFGWLLSAIAIWYLGWSFWALLGGC